MIIELPPFAYEPGFSPRHPDGVFDNVKRSAGSAKLDRCPAWRTGWLYFRAGYYWEAHEVWEAVWLLLPEQSIERAVVQAAIQYANACLKARMGRPNAVQRLCGLALGLLSDHAAQRRVGGVNLADLRAEIQCLADTAESEL
jgi:predicted metal-dependent hydrolase